MHGINFGVNGYGIQYSTSSSFLSPTYQKCTNLNGTTYSYVFTSLSPNTTYYFRAYAQNIESLYGVSTISSGTTPAANSYHFLCHFDWSSYCKVKWKL